MQFACNGLNAPSGLHIRQIVLIYKYETSTLTLLIKPRIILNLPVQNAFYIQSALHAIQKLFYYQVKQNHIIISTKHPKNDKKSLPTICLMAYMESPITYNLGSTFFTVSVLNLAYDDDDADVARKLRFKGTWKYCSTTFELLKGKIMNLPPLPFSLSIFESFFARNLCPSFVKYFFLSIFMSLDLIPF